MAHEESSNKLLILGIVALLLIITVVIASIILNPPPKTGQFSASLLNLDQIELRNENDYPVYNCTFSALSRGDKQLYQYFFTSFLTTDCKQYDVLHESFSCRLSNWVNKVKNYARATQLAHFPEHSQTSIPLDQFYVQDTRKNTAFLSSKKPSDLLSISILCRNSSGRRIQSTQLF